ncbi:MAG: hypothetical protein KDD89_04490 [Anaerolineales bacterium]|nr:hypothetical protein [Anaerolineales bacterium]
MTILFDGEVMWRELVQGVAAVAEFRVLEARVPLEHYEVRGTRYEIDENKRPWVHFISHPRPFCS